ncbi:MAG TPA: hypothetical protein ENG66_01690 [Thermococcus sp.]|nr:hypothetical protein [Thermococcus sp.]
MKKMMQKIKFRPSSHSTDCTLVAILPNKKKAEQLTLQLEELIAKEIEKPSNDWEFPEVTTVKNRLLITINTNDTGSLRLLEKRLKPHATKLELHTCYREIEITIPIPEKATIQILPLLLPKEQWTILKYLLKNSEVKITKHKIKILYRGSEQTIRDPKTGETKSLVTLIKEQTNWKIKYLYRAEDRWIEQLKKLNLLKPT